MTSKANVLIDLFEEAAMNLATNTNQVTLDKLQYNRKSLEDYIEWLEHRAAPPTEVTPNKQ